MSSLLSQFENGILQKTQLNLKDLKNAEKIVVYSSAVSSNGFVNSSASLIESAKVYSYNPSKKFCDVLEVNKYANGTINKDYSIRGEEEALSSINFAIENRNARNGLYPKGFQVYYFPKSSMLKGYITHKKSSRKTNLNKFVCPEKMF